MRTSKIIGGIACYLILASGPQAPARTFTSSDGRTLEAEISNVRGDDVVLKVGIKTYTVPKSRLSEADQKYIEEWLVNRKKNLVPDLEIEINSGKNNRSDRKDSFDDKMGSFNFTIKIENEEQGFDLEDAKAFLVVLGEDCDFDDNYVVMQKESFKVSVKEGDTLEWKGPEVSYKYDDSAPSYWGHVYYGYLFVIKNASGKVIYAKSSKPKFNDHIVKGLNLRLKQAVDKTLKPTGRSVYTYF